MNLSTILALAGLAGVAYSYSGLPGSLQASSAAESARVLAADAMLAVATTKLAAKETELATAAEINAANLAALAAVKADLDRQAIIAAKAQQAERKRAADLKTALKRIHNAPKSDDGPVAPVLRRELDDLRLDSVRPDGSGDAPANPTDQNPIGADDGSG